VNRPAETRTSALSQPDEAGDWFAPWPSEAASADESGFEVFLSAPAVLEVEVSGKVEREIVSPREWEF
jgi:hypothetical protein